MFEVENGSPLSYPAYLPAPGGSLGNTGLGGLPDVIWANTRSMGLFLYADGTHTVHTVLQLDFSLSNIFGHSST